MTESNHDILPMSSIAKHNFKYKAKKSLIDILIFYLFVTSRYPYNQHNLKYLKLHLILDNFSLHFVFHEWHCQDQIQPFWFGHAQSAIWKTVSQFWDI